MRTNLILAGLIFGAIGGFLVGQIGSDILLRIVEDRINQIILLCILAIALITAVFLISDRVIKALTGARNTQILTWFEETTRQLGAVVPVPSKTWDALQKKAQDALAIYISWRVRATLFGMLVAVVVIIVGSISTHVMLEQNRKIEKQNTLLERQNDAVRMQILLAEAERLGQNRAQAEREVVRISQEARAAREKERDALPGDPPFEEHLASLKDEFWDETRLILSILEPYPVIDAKKLVDPKAEFKKFEVEFISRERATILKALLEHRIRLDQVRGLNFDFADMRDFVLSNPYTLHGFVVPGCEIRTSHLLSASLRNVDFAGARLNAVTLPFQSAFNVSGTVFYASLVSLPFGSRLPMDGDRPGFVILYDSQIQLPNPDEVADGTVILDNMHILVEGWKKDGTNCTEIRFVRAPEGPLIPKISLAGASMTVIGVRGESPPSRMDALDQLTALGDGGEETVASVSDTAPMISELLLSSDNTPKDDFAKMLVENNGNVSVRLRKATVTAEQLEHLEGVKLEDVVGLVLLFEKNVTEEKVP